MRFVVAAVISILLPGCSSQPASERPEMEISAPKPVAEAAPKKEESCFPGPNLLAVVECAVK